MSAVDGKAGDGIRIASALGALVLLPILALFTAGAGVVALLGVLAAAGIARARGRRLTRFASWLGASVGAAAGFAGLAAIGFMMSPQGTLEQAQASADSTRAANGPAKAPAWLEKMFPGTQARIEQQEADRLKSGQTGLGEKALTVWMVAIGVAVALGFFGAFIGSAAWPVASLIAMTFTGRWLGTPPPEPLTDSSFPPS